jgi:hypothetical protein
MTYAFGIYFEDDDNLGLVAAGSRWTSGGNSAAARRARVAMQRRDRYGRWAEMGGGIAFSGRNSNNQVVKMVGRYVGPAERPEYMRVYVTSGRGIQTGIYEVPSKVATVAKALLGEDALADAGVKLDVNGKTVGDILDRDIEFIAGMFKGKPTDFELDMARKNLSKAETKVIAKARLKAPAHKSYNIVDKDGNRIDKDEEPTTPDVQKPSKKAKPAEALPIPDLSGLDEKERNRREWYVDANGKRIPANKLTDADKTPENRRIRDLENHRVLDGNGKLVEFKPEYKTEANPIPQGEFKPETDPDDGFWNANQVKPGEVRKDLTTPEAVYEELYNGGFVEVSPELALAAIDVAVKDLPFLGKDENPLFQSNPVDPRFREIANILASLPPAQENRLKRAVNLALMSEEKIDALKAYLDENVEEGVGLSPEAMKEVHRNFRNLGVDITNMRIKGQDAFSNDNLGAERINMPQLDAADQEDFLAYAKRLGVGYKEAVATPQQLHPIQAEMDMGDVGKIKASWLDPELRKKYGMDDQFLFVTRDGYVLDGHHRWSSALLAEMQSGKPINLKVMVLDMDHEDALKFVNEYNDHVGITRQMVGGKNVAQARPTAPKVEAPATPAPRMNMNMAPAGPQGPDGSPIDDWISRNLANNGDLIKPQFADRLTEDTPNQDPEDRLSPIPGSKTVVNNLLKYRDSLMAGLKESSLDGNKEEFKLKFEVAKRVTNLLNKIYDNFLNGKNYAADTEIALSTSNPDEKLKAFRILPNSVVTVTDNNGVKIITDLQAITIGKNGAPYIIKWQSGRDGEASSKAWKLKPDGSYDFNDQSQPYYGGGLSIHRVQTYKRGPNGKLVPRIAEVGGAFTNEYHRAVGLMSGHIFLTRWVQTQFMADARLAHSSNLRPNGTFYGKTVSKDMRDHHRAQADKAVHQNNPDGEIFKVLKSMGLVRGTYVPFDKNATDAQPGGGGANSGGSGWLRRITIVNTNGWSDTKSVLDDYNVHESIMNLKESYFDNKTDDEKAQIVANMPEIFRDFFTGDPDRPDYVQVEKFDVQYNLLGTVYKDGMNKDETLTFLDSLITGIPQLRVALGRVADDGGSSIRKLQSIRDAVANHAWDDANNQYNRPKSFNTNSIRVLEAPFAGNFKFSDWTLDRNFKRISNELPFTPGSKPAGAPVHWTENPTELELRFSPETLLETLKSALKDEKGNVARLPEDRNGNGPMDVNPTAVYKALENGGYDTELMLASIYDEINGNTTNLDNLLAKRNELGNLDDIIAQLVREVGVLEEPVAFSKIGGEYDPENGGVLKSDLIKRHWESTDGNPALNLRDLQPVNETYVDATRNELISAAPYRPKVSNREFYTAGVADNPKIIARNFATSGLKNALIDALQNNRKTVKLKFPNGQELEVSNSAIRDALQHQGYDINKDLSKIPGLRPQPKRLNLVKRATTPDDGLQNWSAFGADDFSENSPVLFENASGSNPGMGVRPNGDMYEVGIVNGAEDKRTTFTAKLAKIQKNADGQYEVWVAKKEDNFAGEFTGTPDGVYPSFANALFDVQKHVMDETNISNKTGIGNDYSQEPALSKTLGQYAVIDNDAPNAVEVAGLTISRPDGTGTTRIFENSGGIRRINNVAVNGSTYVYSLNSNPLADENSPLESLIRHTKDTDGNQVDSPVYNIIKVSDQNLPDKYVVELFGSDSNGIQMPKQTLVVSDLEIAKKIAKRQIRKSSGLSITLTGINENHQENSNEIAAVQPSASVENKSVVSDQAMTTVTTPVKLNGGVEAKAVITVKKGRHPSWRRGVQDIDNRYVYATVNITSPDGTEVYGGYDLVRTAVRRWSVIPKPSAIFERNSPFVGSLPTYSNYWNDKEDAFNDLKRRIDRHFLGTQPQGENKTLFPEERVVNVAAPAQNAIDPAVPARPSENFLSDDKFSDFVAQRGEAIDLSAAVEQGGMGLGASGSKKYELNGKKYKVKIEGGDKARQESFNHAIYKLTGIQVTEARIGVGTPNQFRTRFGNAVDFVVADEFEPNIVPGNINGHMNGQAVFRGTAFRKPENQQAIADLQEGLLMDVLTNNGDVLSNSGNSFIAVRDGVRRGVRCDNGSGGVYEAIGTGRSDGFVNRNAATTLTSRFGDFMARGVVNGTTEDGSMKRGLTPEALQGIARRTILPLTDEKIVALVRGIITNDRDRRDLIEHLKRRRLEILNYLGIDPNSEAPQGVAAQVPNVIPGNTPPTPPNMADNGYELANIDANGVQRIRMSGTAGPNGIFVADNFNALSADVQKQIVEGDLLPEFLPFKSDNTDRPAVVIDGNGIVRPIGKNGMTSIFIRKRKADGTYEYLFARQGRNGNQQLINSNGDKLMPIVYGNPDAADTPLSEMLANQGFAGLPVIGSKEISLPISGLGQNHRIIVADVGSEDVSGVISRATQAGAIRDTYWRIPERLSVRADLYYNQLNGNDDKNEVINKLKEWERTWTASPSTEPSADNDGGVGGNGPTSPNRGGGPSGSGSDSSDSSNDDYLPLSSQTLRDNLGGVRSDPVTVDVQARLADGALKVTEANTGEVLGRIKPTFHGHWEATLLPDQIGNRDRNGEAVKGIFANKIDAQNWLANQIYDRYDVARGVLGQRRPIGEVGTAGQQLHNRNATPLVAISKGYLNPSTENQRNLANRLIEHKQATAEERALFRAILTQDNLTVGEVGWVIGKLRDRDDRDSAELAESRRVREEAAAANPIQPSSLEAVVQAPNTVPIFAKKLKVGQRILGKVNGNVVFTAEGENNTINVGVVGDDGKLKVYKVGRNTVLGIANQPTAAATPNVNAPTHPVIQQRRAQARLIQDRIKAMYPNHRELANGDLVVGQRDVVQADGSRFRYEAVVHKLKSDEFVSFVRKQQIDTLGNPVANGEAAYLTVPGHSPKAVINRLGREVMPVISARNPANGFNQRDDKQAETINPATGLPLPSSIVDQGAQYIGDTGIEKTGNAAKDALISYVQGLVARGQAQPEIVDQIMGGNQRLFSRQQMDDIVERLEWNRQFPGTNAIPYVSKDNKTIVRVGDRVTHYDADGNPKLMENGQPRTGIVTERRPYTLNRKPNGDYEYTDQLYVQWDDTNRPHQAAARRLEVNRRADGAAPVPAVQGPVSGRDNNPPIAPMPLPRGSQAPGQPPATQPEQQTSDLQDIANIGNVRILVVPNGPTYEVERDDNGTQFRDVNAGGYSDIYVVSRGSKWAVRKMDGVNRETLTEFDTRNEAEANAMDRINANNAPAAPVVFPEVGETAQRGSLINANTVGGFGRVVDPSGMGHTIMRGVNMTRFDKDQGDWRDDAIYVQQLGDGKWHVLQQIPNGNGGHDTRSVAINDDRNMSEAIATNIVAGNTTAEAYMRMWGDPNQPVAPENNDSGITQKMEQYRGQIPYPYSLRRETDFVNLGGGNPISLRDDLANADGLNDLRGRIYQDENGNIQVQKWSRNGGAMDRELAKDLDDALQKLVNHAFAMRLERDRDRDNAPESSSPSSSSPTSPDGGDGGVPPTNPPAGGDGGASDGPGLDLNPGNWRQGEPAQGIVGLDGVVPKVNTFWDDDQPPTKYEVIRTSDSTNFVGVAGDNAGAVAFMRVEKTPNGNWRTVDPRERGDARYSAEYASRQVAEALAINKMAGREDLNQDIIGRRPNVAPDAQPLPNGIVESRSEGMTLYNNADGSINEIQVVAIGGGKAWQVTRNKPGQNPEVLSTRATREDGESEARARIAQENDGNSGGNPPAGPSDGGDGGGGVSPTNNPSAGPAATDDESPTSGNSDSELRVGENRAPDGMVENREANGEFIADFNIGQNTFQRIRTPNGNASYYYRGIEIATIEKNSDGTFNVRTIWGADDSDFIVARDEENALLNAQSQIWKANQSGRIEQMDQDFADGNIGEGEASGNETDAIVNKTIGGKEIIRRGKPNGEQLFIHDMDEVGRVEIAPNGKFLAIDVFNGDQTEYDNLDDAIADVEGRIETYAQAGMLDSGDSGNAPATPQVSPQANPEGPTDDGNPPAGPSGGDGGTPPPSNPPAPATPAPANPEPVPTPAPQVPAPQGKPRVNPVQPGDRRVNINIGRDGNKWDIIDNKTRRVIARAKTREIAEEIASGARDLNGKLIDYTTPQVPRTRRPVPPTVPPTQQSAGNVTRNDLGDGVFSVTNQDAEYGLAVRQSDGTWSARVHENPRDAMNNRNPIISGTYANEQEAEDAIRQAIAERQAQRDAANVLQWQSGSDGKQYLGLDGVAGVDAENGPVYGISPSPFGGWALARWDTKASKDAGAQPNSIVAQPDEEAAKNDALQQINDFLRNLTGQNPPLVNDENPTTPSGNRNVSAPAVTPEDQAPFIIPFNPNA